MWQGAPKRLTALKGRALSRSNGEARYDLKQAIARKTKIQDHHGKNSCRSHANRNRFISLFVHNDHHTR